VRRHDGWNSRRHRLDDRHPETLEPRGQNERGGTAIERRQPLVLDVSERSHAGPLQRRLFAPSLPADDREGGGIVEESVRVEQCLQILARLERRDAEQIRLSQILARTLRRE
jgi:hypothetical protein